MIIRHLLEDNKYQFLYGIGKASYKIEYINKENK